MRKLSEFYGQENTTAVLRAMIIKDDIRPQITFYGEYDLCLELMHSFEKALNCLQPVSGDWCGECRNCAGIWLKKVKRRVELVPDTRSLFDNGNVIYVSINIPIDGFFEFDLRSSVKVLNNQLLSHLVYSVFGDYPEAAKLVRSISSESKYFDIVSGYQEIMIAFCYLAVGLETHYDKHEVLSQISKKIPRHRITDALKLTWSAAQASDTKLRSEMFLYMMTDAVNPKPVQKLEITSKTEEKPINVVEEKSERPLTLEELLAIARE